ncbi:MAG: hypothetical protein R3B47_21245 [Bacteroidia bacterium]
MIIWIIFSRAKNDHPEQALKLLKEWLNGRETAWTEAGEDSALGAARRQTKNELEDLSREVDAANALKKRVRHSKRNLQIANGKPQNRLKQRSIRQKKEATSTNA